ncbi:hypothetical protein, partial [Escherichia coli]|uniref:hypothetical protein n=1 Tax=Escherichia coli TaxID=562 RepID=UPI0021C72724
DGIMIFFFFFSTHTFTKHLHEIIFYTPHGCETTTGAFLSEVSPITTKYRRKKRWNACWHTDIQMK